MTYMAKKLRRLQGTLNVAATVVGRGAPPPATSTGWRWRRGRVYGPRRGGPDLLALAQSGPDCLDPRDRSSFFHFFQILLISYLHLITHLSLSLKWSLLVYNYWMMSSPTDIARDKCVQNRSITGSCMWNSHALDNYALASLKVYLDIWYVTSIFLGWWWASAEEALEGSHVKSLSECLEIVCVLQEPGMHVVPNVLGRSQPFMANNKRLKLQLSRTAMNLSNRAREHQIM